MADRAILLTYRDYCELPDDGRRYEIHDGELSVTPAPNPRHQRLVGAIYRILFAHVRSGGLGEVLLSPIDVILSDIAIVQPDVVYLERSRAGAVSSTRSPSGGSAARSSSATRPARAYPAGPSACASTERASASTIQ